MFTPSNIGILIAIISVIAAYFVGHASGYASGQDHGFGEGRREGTREGSKRGYAIGYDRARRQTDSEDEPASAGGIGFGIAALLLTIFAVFVLASGGSKTRHPRVSPTAPEELVSTGAVFYGQPNAPRDRTPPFKQPLLREQPPSHDGWIENFEEHPVQRNVGRR